MPSDTAANITLEHRKAMSRSRTTAGSGGEVSWGTGNAFLVSRDHTGRRSELFHWSGGRPFASIRRRRGVKPLPPILPQGDDQVDHDRDVHEKDPGPDVGELPDELVDLEGDERASGDDDQVLGPVIAEDQPDPLDRVERGVEERADLQGAELGPTDAGDPGEDLLDKVVVRVKAEVDDDPLGVRPGVVAEEAEDPEPHEQGGRAADQLHRADHPKADVPRPG